jgi:hypothetical protein
LGIRVSASHEKAIKPSSRDGRVELSRVRLRLTKTTGRLNRHVEAIRNREITPSGLAIQGRSSSTGPGYTDPALTGSVGVDPDLAQHYSNPRPTLDYPAQGKVQTLPAGCMSCADWEPAERLRVAIVVGRDELTSGMIRNHFGRQRRQRHDALVYRWQGEFTLDVIGFDAIDPDVGRNLGRVDLVLLSDWILGPKVGRAPVRDLERIALQTRLRFRDSYIVGLMADPDGSDLKSHAFHSVERKARSKGIVVFDQVLPSQVSPERITRLLVSYGRSHRYTADRSVWITPADGDGPVPIRKEDLSPVSS